MEYLLMFIFHSALFIGVVISTLFINQYNSLLAIGFDILYLITVKLVSDELEIK